MIASEELMRRVVEAGGPFADHVQSQYLDYTPLEGLSQYSAMWDELAIAALIDPSIITETQTMWLDVDITHGPKYGHTVVWTRPREPLTFFMSYSGPGALDRDAWASLLDPPTHLQPAEVQMDFDRERFEGLFVEMMSR